MINIPPNIPRSNSPIGRKLGNLMLKMMGWKIAGTFPSEDKFVAAVAPHTSNWDFFIGIAVKLALDVEIRFLGKHTIFIPPFGWLLRKWGGIPVRRDTPHGMVTQVRDIFNANDKLILGLAPEGTRKYTSEWKKGFIYIAQSAKVPIVPMAIDYRSKTFVVMPAINNTTEFTPDQLLHQVKQQFSKQMAKYPEHASGL
ncbi:acyltransferase [Pseudoalteromonas piscicida]|uniref:Acyltransferase n=2 Tax=Pseudoalteromonas TaxID=53246 RepID=A0AAQ2ESU4_PSEO7|nr:1-acyl-sn-glycerol-3-phosphate acyltransferase [Pseudoalteromonas piscicida]TMN83630.1 acyltransferase [Pseudoalteromonas flavipulchra]KJY85728.1 acyltransferase [Pseudoalteromonas piscicida]TMN35111.1 acyltransferase [Pseudoalteromonas piscicida]TMN36186.1 acyltransferase [Pseudoalteromonas piscicida]TMN47460.1 acyltransferase [Pseudoalteromonas piscicida]